jgi:phosphoglycolate phosphatase
LEQGYHFMNHAAHHLDWLKDVEAIAFDKDGTFIDFAGTWGGALNKVIAMLSPDADEGRRVAEMLGFDRASVTFDPHSSFVGGSQDVYGPAWAQILGLPYDAVFTRRIADAFDAHVFASLSLIDGAEGALRQISLLGLPLSVATNDAIRATLRQLDHLGLAGLFAFVAGYDSGHGAKPGGGMIRAFAQSRGLSPSRVLMVGDSINDALAADEAGAYMIGLRTGPEAHPDFEALCDLVLPSIRDLPAVLAGKSA